MREIVLRCALVALLPLSWAFTPGQMGFHNTIVKKTSFQAHGSLQMVTASVLDAQIVNEKLPALSESKTRDIIKSAQAGRVKKREAVKAAAARLRSKAISAVKTSRKNASPSTGLLTEAATATDASGKSVVMEGGWKKRAKSLAIVRTAEIWVFAIKFFIRESKLKKIEDKAELSARRVENANYLKEGLLRLGPTFIKLGQLLSTRVDILPKEYIQGLASLQDDVPGFPGSKAIEIIEEDLGKPISELFDTFDETPIAAASLGQVHIATKGNEKYAVKVQRQGLKELFDVDLQNLKLLAKILDLADPKFDGADRDWVSIYEESAKLLYREINYNLEAQNAQRFKENFANIEWVKVPDIIWDKVSTRVVTMEFVPGIKINNIEEIERRGIDRQLLAKRSAECYLNQLCRNGFFHCDPHPGNVACDEKFGGRLIYYDFGMMDEFKPNVKSGLVNLIFGIYENDAVETCDALEEMGILREGSDRVSVEKIARFFLNEFSGTINQKEGKWVQELDKEQAKEIRKQRRLKLGQDLLTVGNDVPFKFPPTFTFVFRAFTSLDGIGKGLDPKYDLTRLAQPYLKELVDLRDGSVINSVAKVWGKKLGWRPVDIANVVTEPRKVAYLENTLRKMEQGDLKLRVRVLEAERSFARLDIVQTNMMNLISASAFLNMGLLLRSTVNPSGQIALATKAAFVLAGVFGLQVPLGALKVSKLDKQNKQYGLTK